MDLKTGAYAVEGKALGFLVKKGKQDFSFWVATAQSGASNDFSMWESKLKPAGKDSESGKPRFKLPGHPKGGFFVQTSDTTFSERDPDQQERDTWTFREDVKGKFLTSIAAPPVSAKTFPTDNFALAVLNKDPSHNEPCSPPTSVIIEACCSESELPEDAIERQKALAKFYTMETPLYHEMNKALRDDDLSAMKYYSAYIKELRDVFKTDHEDQVIEPFVGQVWRGITFDDPEQALKDFPVGNTFVWSAFTSMSTTRDVAFGFGNVVFEVSCLPPKEAYQGAIAVYAPASVSAFSDFEGEAEILFPPNIQFQVKEIKMPGGDDESITSPLIICETVAFDSDEGLKEFQEFKKMLDSKLADGTLDDTPPDERALAIKQGYKRLFDAVDANGSGGISRKETKAAFMKIKGAVAFAETAFPGISLPGEDPKAMKAYVNEMFQAADMNHDGTLSFEEVFGFIVSKHGSPEEAASQVAGLSTPEWTSVKKTLDAIVTAFEHQDFSSLRAS